MTKKYNGVFCIICECPIEECKSAQAEERKAKRMISLYESERTDKEKDNATHVIAWECKPCNRSFPADYIFCPYCGRSIRL